VHISTHAALHSKILIANRGEIAVRIIRTCRELGIASVAVYSELDRDAMHVRIADEAYALGGQTAAESYLNTDAILDALRSSGADAVHPGYGFFSENAEFARAITEMGVAFIGPPPAAIDVMGDKISARAAAEKVGVSGVPGNTEEVTSASQVTAFGGTHGFPVAVKAAYGGGGRGMKVVHDGDDITAAIDSARREALAYFGRGELYLERYLTNPRHIEVQLIADTHGNCVHLGTRDCSAQRRHQKLIEEAPAPGIDPQILEAMGQAAVKVAQGCDYVNAGTVEFLYEDGAFWYLEMNTRLQVEHPVTELVTGLDLVAEQIRVSSGMQLPFTQDQIQTGGHAIEVRINAEDPAEGAFLPSPGRVQTLRVPNGVATRFDAGYESGDEVSQFYDNLIGKLVCWGPTRDVAIARTLRALRELDIVGPATTIPADVAILSHPDFVAVQHSTNWVESTLDLTGVSSAAAGSDAVEAGKVRQNVDVEVNGKRFEVAMWLPETFGASTAAAAGAAKKPRRASGQGAGKAKAGSGQIAVPMQGTVVSINVAVGDAVATGDTLLVLEAMKMENNITADKDGQISEIVVATGDSVGAGDVVIVIS